MGLSAPAGSEERVKVIIAGSRAIGRFGPEHGDRCDWPLADELVRMGVRIARLRGWEITEVVWGKAHGVDAAGKRWADKNGIPVKPFPADWGQYGKKAGYLRNGEMALYADALIAIHNGSPGTAHMIQFARNRKMPMVVIEVPWDMPRAA